jgi:hypothetical protein
MIRNDIHAACMATLDRFMEALNEHDALGMDATMHLPHLRLADGKTVSDACVYG